MASQGGAWLALEKLARDCGMEERRAYEIHTGFLPRSEAFYRNTIFSRLETVVAGGAVDPIRLSLD